MDHGYVRVIIHAELDGMPVFIELIVPADQADKLAAGMLDGLRGSAC